MRETAERTATLEQEVRTRQQAETDARNSRARNDAILEVALDPVILMDEAGHVVQFNPAAERTFGYSAAEAVGIELSALIVPADKDAAHRAGLSAYLKTGQSALLNRRLELAAVRKGGLQFPVEVAIAPISSDGSAMFAGYLRDITERRQAEAALAERMSLASLTAAVGLALTRGAELRAMLQMCAEALVQHLDGGLARIWTLERRRGGCSSSRPAPAMHTGFDQARSRVPIGTLRDRHDRRRTRIRGWTTPSTSTRRPAILTGLGDEGMVAFAGYPLLLDSKLVGVMALYARHEFSPSALDAMAAVADGIALGIERKRAERELARYTPDLEQAHKTERQNAEQLSTLVDQLRDDPAAGRSGDPRQERFPRQHEPRAAHAAERDHSLQRAAAGRGRGRGPASSRSPTSRRIQSAGKHLLELINGILDLSKIEAGKMALSLETFEVRAMIDELLDTVGPARPAEQQHPDRALQRRRSAR